MNTVTASLVVFFVDFPQCLNDSDYEDSVNLNTARDGQAEPSLEVEPSSSDNIMFNSDEKQPDISEQPHSSSNIIMKRKQTTDPLVEANAGVPTVKKPHLQCSKRDTTEMAEPKTQGTSGWNRIQTHAKAAAKHRFVRNRIIQSDSESPDSTVEPDSPDSETDAQTTADSSTIDQAPVSRKVGLRVKWTEDELSIMKRQFARYIKGDGLPLSNDIEKLKECHSIFKNRSNAKIKARFVHLKKTGR